MIVLGVPLRKRRLFCSLISDILLLVVKDSQWIDTSEKPHLPLGGGAKESEGNEEWRFR